MMPSGYAACFTHGDNLSLQPSSCRKWFDMESAVTLACQEIIAGRTLQKFQVLWICVFSCILVSKAFECCKICSFFASLDALTPSAGEDSVAARRGGAFTLVINVRDSFQVSMEKTRCFLLFLSSKS